MAQVKSPWIRGIFHLLLIAWGIYSVFPFLISILTSTMVVRDVIARDPKFVPQWLVTNNVTIALVIGIIIIAVYFLMAQAESRTTATSAFTPLSLTVLGIVLLVVSGGIIFLTSLAGEDQIFQPTIQAYQEIWLRNDAAVEAFPPIGIGLLVLVIALIVVGVVGTTERGERLGQYIAMAMTAGATFFASRQIIEWVTNNRIDGTFLARNAESVTYLPDWLGVIVTLIVGALALWMFWQMDSGRIAINFAIVYVIVSVIFGLPQYIRFGTFYESFLTSVIVTVCTVFVSISIGCLAAYALARYRGITGFLILITALGFRALPRLAFILPYYYFANLTGLFDTHILLIVTFVTINQPFTIWMLRSFFMDIPREIEESAMIDGCNRLTAFTRVIIPIVWPGIITTALFSMLLAYNEFLLASLLTSTVQTLPVAMSQFTSGETLRVLPAMNASAVSITIPIVIMIIFFQRYLIKGLAGGAVKG